MLDISRPYTWRVTIGSHSPILKPSLGQAQLIQRSNYRDGTPSTSKHTLPFPASQGALQAMNV